MADAANLAVLQNFWSSCNDQQAIEDVGVKPFLEVVQEITSAWRGGKTKGADGFVVQGYGQTNKPKKAPRWDPDTAVERLTNVLTYLHSRGRPRSPPRPDPQHWLLTCSPTRRRHPRPV